MKRAFGWPFRRVLDPRVDAVVAAMDERLGSESEARPSVHDRLDRIELLETHLGGHLARLEERLSALDAVLETRLLALLETGGALIEGTRVANESLAGFEPEYQIPPMDRRALAELRWPAAEFVNWATGPAGYAAQSGLWFAEGVRVELGAGGAEVGCVGDRLVEEPFCFAALAPLAPPARVVVAGGGSTVALSLAAMGHDVTVIGTDGYPFEGPGLRALPPDQEAGAGGGGCDALVALSSIDDGDTLERACRFCRPGALLVLTLPVAGAETVRGTQLRRVADVQALIDGWDVDELRVAWRQTPVSWVAGSPERPEGDRGVALVRARAPRE